MKRIHLLFFLTGLLLSACGASNAPTAETEPQIKQESTSETIADQDTPEASANCSPYDEAFSLHLSPESVNCASDFLEVNATGLPDLTSDSSEDVPMVGIQSWIQRVPVPYSYNWRIPLSPDWQAQPTEASARGPIAVAVDGVPIFHYERRPDVSTSLDNYEQRNDTVVQNELDQCGGHSGQGEDYHYHYAPICLMDGHNPDLPIAFGLDGAPVYFGEGGDDYYGRGRYSDLSYLPEEALDECNALQQPDGGFVHFTTKTPPYVVGCHHGFFDRQLQIEPRPFDTLAQRTASPLGGSYGEPVRTLITNFEEVEEGAYRLTFNSLDASGGESSILYRQTSDSCWTFEYQTVSGETDTTTEACRHTHNNPN